MVSERLQRRIDKLLDEAEEAADRGNWDSVKSLSARVLAIDATNEDAIGLVFYGRCRR